MLNAICVFGIHKKMIVTLKMTMEIDFLVIVIVFRTVENENHKNKHELLSYLRT
jgi:hypothetical protein